MRSEFPGFRVVAKSRSRLMQWIYYGLGMSLWNPRFITSFVTTIGKTVYMPVDLISSADGYRILRHERIHILQSLRWPILYQLSYVIPLPFLNGRWWWELEAYTETMRVWHEDTGEVPNWLIDNIADYFVGPAYFFMFPARFLILRMLKSRRNALL